MPCYTPLKAYRAPGGGVAFDSRRGYADRPLELRCGQCIGCRLEHSRQWATRMIHEAQMHTHNSFITLTYDKEHLPQDGSLKVDHWQRFAKRLRQSIGPFRFFHCGEYGGQTNRPHYHACLFGYDFTKDRVLLRKTLNTNLYTSPLLQQIWGNGYVTVGDLTYQSAAYVARYCLKKITGDLAKKVHYGDRRPEYVTMSRRPGIGSTWYEKFHTDVFPSDEVVHNGKKFKPPRYYDEKLTPKQLLTVRKNRADKAAKFQKDRTPERLKAREQVTQAKIKQLTRQL